MPSPRQPRPAARPSAESYIDAYSMAVQDGQRDLRLSIANDVVEKLGPLKAADQLLSAAGRLQAEGRVLREKLDERNQLLASLMAEPRRIDQVLGLIDEPDEQGGSQAWAVLKGPPNQAVRLSGHLDPEEICPDQLEQPVWVWLINSDGGLVVAGRIEPPALLSATPERELVFDGFADSLAETGDEHGCSQ